MACKFQVHNINSANNVGTQCVTFVFFYLLLFDINLQFNCQINVLNQDTGKKEEVWSEKSYPWKWSANYPAIGVQIDAEGPSHLENVCFLNFKSTDIRRAAAIEWRNGYM